MNMTQPKPTALKVHPKQIPPGLKDLPQWVLWRYTLTKKGKWTKVPYTRFGDKASSTNPQTWDTFENVFGRYIRGNDFDGIGICMAPGDGLVGVDLDKCVGEHGSLSEDCKEILRHFDAFECYSEKSPSGRGLRIFCYGKAQRCGKGGEGNWIEVYDHTSPRYLTVTGNGRGDLVDGQVALDWLHDRHMKKDEPVPLAARPATPVSLDVSDLLDKARSASNGQDFIDLYDRGNDRGDHSSADLALCNHLAFWLGCDAGLMDQAFRQSALMRPKWDSRRGNSTYGLWTIQKAIDRCSDTYNPSYRTQTSLGSPVEESDDSTETFQKDGDWRDKLKFTYYKNGTRKVKKSDFNLSVILQNDPLVAGCIAWDKFSSDVVCVQEPPWNSGDCAHSIGKTETFKPWTDRDYHRLKMWLQYEWDLSFSGDTIIQTVCTAAEANSFHPVRDYLNQLEWDGVKRLDNWLVTYLGAEPKSYATLVGPKWMIAAVARIYSPGCKVDNVLILEGQQGLRKSTALKVLANPQWFSDTPFHIGSKDAFLAMQGVWVVELAELDSLMKADDREAKAFFSSAEDKYRLPYAKTVENFPRQCVFAGTVNEKEYLRDATGSRRYWPVECFKVDLVGLERDRDQLWAEAVARYRVNERHWLEGDENLMAREEQEQRATDDPWESPIFDWLGSEHSGKDKVTVSDILDQAIGMNLKDMNRSHQTRVGRIMTRRGWVRTRPRIKGEPTTLYCRPETITKT